MFTVNEMFHKKVDVLVVGGGVSGLAAAICAARGGVKVMLMDSNGYLGGMATAGLVGPFMTSYDPNGEKQIIKGFYEEFVRRMEADGGAIHPSECLAYTGYSAYRIAGHSHVGPFNSETFKLVAEKMCEENNVELLYHSTFIEPVMADNKKTIESVVAAVKGGVGIIDSEIFIDCTGNADLAYLSGAPTEKPDEVQPASLFCIIANVNKEKLEEYKSEHPLTDGQPNPMVFSDLFQKARDAGKYPVPKYTLGIYESCDNTWRVNMSRINGVDGTDPFDVTNAEISGRKQLQIILDFLRKNIPGCENIIMTESASQLGIRESRRIVGEYVLTEDDLHNSRIYDDNIALCGNAIDMHKSTSVAYETIKSGKPYGIPYRCLVPKNIDNLLVAGRNISCTRQALSAIRVMPPCFAMGQAAGCAAAIAISDNCKLRYVNIETLQKNLRSGKAIISLHDIT